MNDQAIRALCFYAEHMRRDCYAVRSPSGKYTPILASVSQLVIERHLADRPVGLYWEIGDKTRIAVLDCDSHHGEVSWPEMVALGLEILGEARKLGLRAHVHRSGGGSGLHISFVWEKPQNTRYVRHLLRRLLTSLGLRDGAGGVARREVEVFPKQDRVEAGKYGNLIALPGARASVPLDDATLEPIEWDIVDVPAIIQRVSDPVPEVAEETQRPGAFVRLEGDEETVKAALKHVPANDYHSWIDVMLALKFTFGEDALPIFDEWSASAPDKYPGPDKIRRRWMGARPDGRIGLGSIFHMAHANGWNGPRQSVVREMNARFGILTIGSKTLIIVKNGDRRPEDEFNTLSKATFIDRLAPETFTVPGDDGTFKTTPKSTYWLSHRHAAHYYRLDFDPAMPPGDNCKTWNTWTGFGVEPHAGDWSLLKTHIFENVSNGSENKYEWMLNWMAHTVQNRGEVPGTAPVLIGMPGTGKGVLAHAFGRLWGSHFIAVTHPEHVLGRFSGHLMSRRFVFIDEGTFGGDRKQAGQLKTRITDPILVFERKGIDAIPMKNRMIFMIASNEASVVPADKNDRRWMMFEVADHHREDHDYFRAIQRQLDDGGYEAMLHELLHRDWKVGPNPTRIIKTTALFEQIIQVQGAEIGYIHMILDHGRLPQNWLDGASVTTIRALVEELRRTFIGSSGYVTEISFGRTLNKVFKTIHRQPHGRYFVKMGDLHPVMQRSVRYGFGDLATARREFEQYIGVPVEWNEDIVDWQSDPEPEWHEDDTDVI